MIELHRDNCMIKPHKPLIDGSHRLKPVTITKRALKLQIAIHDALVEKYFNTEKDCAGKQAEALNEKVNELVSLFYQRGLTPIKQNIDYFINNCI